MIQSKPRPIFQTNATFHPWGWCEHNHLLNKSDFNKPIPKTPNSNLGDNLHDGYLSPAAIKRLKKAVNMLSFIADNKSLYPDNKECSIKFKLNFVTLQLCASQLHSDEYIKSKMLDPFIKALKYHFGLVNYIWKAEKQDNGNIHFHITTDCYIPWQKVRQLWQHQLSRYGYVERYRLNQIEKHRDGFYYDKSQYVIDKLTKERKQINYKVQLNAYNEGIACGWTNPNCTDVHPVINVHNLAAYMGSYMAKKDYWKKERPKEVSEMINDGDRTDILFVTLPDDYRDYIKKPISGKIWDCSKNLKNTGMLVENTELYREEFQEMKLNQVSRVIETDFCTIFIRSDEFRDLMPVKLGTLYIDHLLTIKYDCCSIQKHQEKIKNENTIQELLTASNCRTSTEAEMRNLTKSRRFQNPKTRKRASIRNCQLTIQLKF